MSVIFQIGGKIKEFSDQVLAFILDVPLEGYSEYTKGSWPASVAKAEVIQRVGEDPNPKNHGKQGNANTMGIVNRTLHRILTANITPRLQKHSVINFQDFLLLDKLLSKAQISLPRQVLLHMNNCASSSKNGLPYPGFVKKILEYFNVYEPAVESLVSNPLSMESFNSMGWIYDELSGWSKGKVLIVEKIVELKEEIEGSTGKGKSDSDVDGRKKNTSAKDEENTVSDPKETLLAENSQAIGKAEAKVSSPVGLGAEPEKAAETDSPVEEPVVPQSEKERKVSENPSMTPTEYATAKEMFAAILEVVKSLQLRVCGLEEKLAEQNVMLAGPDWIRNMGKQAAILEIIPEKLKRIEDLTSESIVSSSRVKDEVRELNVQLQYAKTDMDDKLKDILS